MHRSRPFAVGSNPATRPQSHVAPRKTGLRQVQAMVHAELVGTWQDGKGTEYKVSQDGPASWTVKTCRPDGKKRVTKGLLQVWQGAIYWGNSYYLDILEDNYCNAENKGIIWQPIKWGKVAYRWWPVARKSEHFIVKRAPQKELHKTDSVKSDSSSPKSPWNWDSPKTQWDSPKTQSDSPRTQRNSHSPKSSEGSQSQAPTSEMIMRITGKWKDDKGSRYEVVPDPGATSCTVVTTRPTGKVLTTSGLIKYKADEGSVYWGSKFRLELKDSHTCVWIPLRSGKPFHWQADSPRPVVTHTNALPTARSTVEASAQLQDGIPIACVFVSRSPSFEPQHTLRSLGYPNAKT